MYFDPEFYSFQYLADNFSRKHFFLILSCCFIYHKKTCTPLRQWKQSELDVQAQERWDDFTNVKYKMLKKTHTSSSPWTIIRSNNKHQARLNAIKT
ncbi:MAG: hypothetical protein KZQ67_16855 [gamma proteobacterium symbiont of Bathyaustriella thionipta]|nr:hypothetical protein [gamma proteobacterium symbiont of Bathyaustriella thionipta]MCU7951655.1 hypothetical protein [gamma proteobacterium symbiont of Bathyaustriella thionipta]MCU7958250.1 hypothetical protein [gamma proteobacterium symbiont of Bathyaustriella thionipta]